MTTKPEEIQVSTVTFHLEAVYPVDLGDQLIYVQIDQPGTYTVEQLKDLEKEQRIQ